MHSIQNDLNIKKNLNNNRIAKDIIIDKFGANSNPCVSE